MCSLEQAIRHPVLAISHTFEGSYLAPRPLRYTTFHPAYKFPPTSPTKVPSTGYPVTQEQNVYNYDLVPSIGAGEEGRRIS